MLAAAWQNIGFSRETHECRTVWHINGDVCRLVQRLANFRREPGADLHLIACAVLQAFQTKLLAVLYERLRVLAVNRNKLGNVTLRAREVFGKLQAQTRRACIRFGFVIGHAETVLGTQPVISFACGLISTLCASLCPSKVHAHFVRVDRRAPIRAPLQSLAKNTQGFGFAGCVLGKLIAAISSA